MKRDIVLACIVLEGSEVAAGLDRITNTENEAVRIGLIEEELFDDLEPEPGRGPYSLGPVEFCARDRKASAPVAMTVLTAWEAIRARDFGHCNVLNRSS